MSNQRSGKASSTFTRLTQRKRAGSGGSGGGGVAVRGTGWSSGLKERIEGADALLRRCRVIVRRLY